MEAETRATRKSLGICLVAGSDDGLPFIFGAGSASETLAFPLKGEVDRLQTLDCISAFAAVGASSVE